MGRPPRQPVPAGRRPRLINSDLAFTGDHLIQGNFAGFSVWDIADPAAPTLVSAVSCPGGQGDVSAVGNLVFVSVDETMSDDSCQAARVPETDENWEGVRIFDVSDPASPQYVAAVRTRCGSHTHTVVPDPASADRVFVYVSAYSRGASRNCTGRNPLQIIAVPLVAPEEASVVGELDLFDDESAFGPQDRVPGGAETRSTTGCHDITAYPAKALAVAACRGDGLLLSIADPLAPVVRSGSATPRSRSGTPGSSTIPRRPSSSRTSSATGSSTRAPPRSEPTGARMPRGGSNPTGS